MVVNSFSGCMQKPLERSLFPQGPKPGGGHSIGSDLTMIFANLMMEAEIPPEVS
jgi:hypothetical protein